MQVEFGLGKLAEQESSFQSRSHRTSLAGGL
jgi:hypothetical protein